MPSGGENYGRRTGDTPRKSGCQLGRFAANKLGFSKASADFERIGVSEVIV